MRHTIAVVVMLFILTVGLVMPAAAGGFDAVQSTTSSSATSLGWSLPIFLESDTRSPAGRISFYFTDSKYGEPLFYYLGSSRELLVGADIPAFRWCIARVELTGAYANQVVRSSWGNLGGMESNTFCHEVGTGEQEGTFYIRGRKNNYLRILFAKVPIGSSGFVTEQSFRVYCQGAEGLTDYMSELLTARESWPAARFFDLEGRRFVQTGAEGVNWAKVADTHDMWATLQVYETWYRSQGMVIAGTERFPRNNTRSLGNLMEAYQRKLEAEAQAAETAAAEADYQRQLEEANAERDAARRAQAEEAARNQRLQREVDEARAAAAQRLSNPPAPVTTTTTETTTEVVQPRPESPVVRVNFRINLPDGVVTRVETLDDRGSRVYDRRYAGYIPMNNYPEGLTFCLRLTWEGASAPDPWKVVRDVHDGMTVEYQNLEVR